MAHQLSPKPGQPYLSPGEVVRRLREEFAVVEADQKAGADFVEDMIASTESLRMRRPREDYIRALREAQAEAIWIRIADDAAGEATLAFVAMPGSGLFIGYESGEHQDATEGLLRRCAEGLGYETKLI